VEGRERLTPETGEEGPADRTVTAVRNDRLHDAQAMLEVEKQSLKGPLRSPETSWMSIGSSFSRTPHVVVSFRVLDQ